MTEYSFIHSFVYLEHFFKNVFYKRKRNCVFKKMHSGETKLPLIGNLPTALSSNGLAVLHHSCPLGQQAIVKEFPALWDKQPLVKSLAGLTSPSFMLPTHHHASQSIHGYQAGHTTSQRCINLHSGKACDGPSMQIYLLKSFAVKPVRQGRMEEVEGIHLFSYSLNQLGHVSPLHPTQGICTHICINIESYIALWRIA